MVTGCAGFIGSHLAEVLLNQGDQVIGVDAFIPYYPRVTKEANIREIASHPQFELHEIDLRFGDLVPLLKGVDAVIHLAAMPGLPRSWSRFDEYLTCNVLATQRLIEACLQSGIQRFVHGSTSSVYGTLANGDEGRPTRPASPYGVTKLAAEHLVQAYTQNFELPAVILRYFSIYGPRQRPDMAYHRFIEAMLDREPLTVFGDGLQSRTNTYVADCVEGTVLALQRGRIGSVYNIGGGEAVTLNQAIDLIADVIGTVPEIIRQPARAGDQRHTRANVCRATQDLGWTPKTSPAEGLARQVAWHRKRRLAPAQPYQEAIAHSGR